MNNRIIINTKERRKNNLKLLDEILSHDGQISVEILVDGKTIAEKQLEVAIKHLKASGDKGDCCCVRQCENALKEIEEVG